MVFCRADRAAVLGRDAERLLHAHKGEGFDFAVDNFARFFVETRYLVARFNVDDIDFVVDVAVLVRFGAAVRFATAAQLGVPRHAQAGDVHE